MKLLVVIVTYNAMKWIDKCLRSLEKSTFPNDVYIIDNGSSDGTYAYIVERYPQVRIELSQENLGFGRANNIGLNYAIQNGYDYVYLLNQDAWVNPDAFKILIDAHLNNPIFGILSPMQLQANLMHFDSNFRQNIGKKMGGTDLLERLFFKTSEQVFEVEFVMAAHWLISRECLRRVGGFSPSFPHYGEDDNYISRAKFHGFKVGIVPDALAVHDRESRVISSEKQFYIKWYIGTIIKYSSIYNKYGNYILKYCMKSLTEIIHFKFYPVKYSVKLLKSYFFMRKNKKASFTEGAFLIKK